MFQYFFKEGQDIPYGVGFELYDKTHLIWLFFLGFTIISLCVYFKGLPAHKKGAFLKVFASIIMGMELLKDLILLIIGKFAISYLPLHLCGISCFILLWQAFANSSAAAEIAYSLGLVGALAALLFADWTGYPVLNFMHINSFVIHSFLVAYPLMLVTSGYFRPNPKRLWQPTLFILLISPPIYLINKAFNQNFLFINVPSKGSPLEVFEQYLGNPGYLVGLAALIIIVWVILYIPFYKNK